MRKKPKTKRIKVRRLWTIDPRTQIEESAKKYRRSKQRRELKDIVKDFL